MNADQVQVQETCPSCNGTGKIMDVAMYAGVLVQIGTQSCLRCDGTGKVWVRR